MCPCNKFDEFHVFAKPGENQALVSWTEPGFKCPVNFTRKEINPHGITSPASFSLGAHTITYSYWFDSLEKPVECPINFRVHGKRNVKLSNSNEWTFPLFHEILKKFKIGKNITTALKSILSLVKLQSLVVKCCKM